MRVAAMQNRLYYALHQLPLPSQRRSEGILSGRVHAFRAAGRYCGDRNLARLASSCRSIGAGSGADGRMQESSQANWARLATPSLRPEFFSDGRMGIEL